MSRLETNQYLEKSPRINIEGAKLIFVQIPRTLTGFLLLLFTLLLTACGKDEERIASAQSTYRALVASHNAVAEAHREISDASLDDALLSLQASVEGFKELNLYAMEDEELDALTEEMNGLRGQYDEYLEKIAEIKAEEDARIITQTSFTLVNGTYLTFTGLTLKEQGASGPVTDILEDLPPFDPGSELVGLTLHRDAADTPWILTLSAEEESYELLIDPVSLKDSGNILTVRIEEETEDAVTLKLS